MGPSRTPSDAQTQTNRTCPGCGAPLATDGAPCPSCGSASAPASLVRTEPSSSPASTSRSGRVVPGTRLGDRYIVTSTLGAGGMGEVYRARDVELDRDVAIKLVHPALAADDTALSRFRREVLLSTRITHPNVLRVFDLAEASGIKFLTMQLIEGEDLAARIRRDGKLRWREMVAIVREIARGLEAAHVQGVVHRDLKPRNVLIDREGNVYVADFGLAVARGQAELTASGALLGSPKYMAPEQVRGEHVDPRTDVYALGLLAYQMVTGELPFKGETPFEILAARVQSTPPSLGDVAPEVPKRVAQIVDRCLASAPTDRFPSAGPVADALDAFAKDEGLTQSLRPSGAPRALSRPPSAAGWVRRFWPVLALLTGAALAFVVVRSHPASQANPSATPSAGAPPTAPTSRTVTLLVADFANRTGEPMFDGAIEPMFNVALEGASFIAAYDRGDARKLAAKLPHPSDKLDDASARLVAVSQGVSTVVVGSLSTQGADYAMSASALDAMTGAVIAKAEVTATSRNDVLTAVPKLAAPIRKALGDSTPEAAQATMVAPFTAASIEVVHEYVRAMEAQWAGNIDEAFRAFSRTAELDPNFGRAYFGMAAMAHNLGRNEDSEKYFELALEHIDRMTERERYHARGAYYAVTGNNQKCIEEFGALLVQYPSDFLARMNLAYCYSASREFPKSIEELRRALDISPKAVPVRENLALTLDYAGDFVAGEREARTVIQLNPTDEYGYLVLGYSLLGQGRLRDAADAYDTLQGMSSSGASYAALAHADMALYEGHFADAVRILETRIPVEIASGQPRVAEQLVALAYAQLSRQKKKAALDAGEHALKSSKKANIRVLTARIFVEAGQPARARSVADALGTEPTTEPQAYAHLIEGEIALAEKNPRKAIHLFSEAQKTLDTWLGRFDLGRAYLDAGLFTEADSEFDRCIKRRGEALELDDGPTYAYFPPVYYYQGRVREGLKSPGFAQSYRTYLDIRGKAAEDALLSEIERRLGGRAPGR